MMKPRISMVALGVDDLEKSVAFYRDGLGLPHIDSPPEVAFFELNGTWLGLAKREALANDASVPADGSGYRGFNLSHNVPSVNEVDHVAEQAASAGATIVKPPQKTTWGGYHAYFKDLDGHLWEVAYNPYLWIGPQDQA